MWEEAKTLRRGSVLRAFPPGRFSTRKKGEVPGVATGFPNKKKKKKKNGGGDPRITESGRYTVCLQSRHVAALRQRV